MNGNIFELVFVFFMLPGAEGLQVLRSRALPQSHLPVKSCAHPQLSRFPNSSPRSSASNVLHKRDGIRRVAFYGRPLVF